MSGPAGKPRQCTDRDRLHRLLGDPDLTWLVERVRRRMEREEALTGPVTLAAPTPAQRAAAERLLGRSPGTGRSLSVRLEAVDEVLRRSGISPEGLAPAVTALTGPITRLAAVREQQTQAWQDAYTPLSELGPELSAWAERLRQDGLVRRLTRTPETAKTLLTGTATALRALPAEPAVSLPAFANAVLGDAHALDDGTPLATVVLSEVRALTGFPDGSGAEWRREAWASAGLLKDALSSTVLTLGLRGTPALDWLADVGRTGGPDAAPAHPRAAADGTDGGVRVREPDRPGHRGRHSRRGVRALGLPPRPALGRRPHPPAPPAQPGSHPPLPRRLRLGRAAHCRHAAAPRAMGAVAPHRRRLPRRGRRHATGPAVDRYTDRHRMGCRPDSGVDRLGVRVEEEAVLEVLLADLAP